MATIALVQTKISGFPYHVDVLTWAGLTSASAQGDPISYTQNADRSIQFSGTFGGATATLQGSNDNVTFFVLTDPLGNALTFAANGLKQIMELTAYVKPVTTGGDGTQAITAVIVGRVSKV